MYVRMLSRVSCMNLSFLSQQKLSLDINTIYTLTMHAVVVLHQYDLYLDYARGGGVIYFKPFLGSVLILVSRSSRQRSFSVYLILNISLGFSQINFEYPGVGCQSQWTRYSIKFQFTFIRRIVIFY